MGFRFRKSIKLIPGIRLNLSKSGPSISVGGKGFTYNVSKKGSRATVSLPGTGISYSSYQSHGHKADNNSKKVANINNSTKVENNSTKRETTVGWIIIIILILVFLIGYSS